MKPGGLTMIGDSDAACEGDSCLLPGIPGVSSIGAPLSETRPMSKITVIGGTGYAGTALVKAAAARGHQVTAVSRSQPSAPVAGVTYVAAPVTEALNATDGADVIIAALSPRGDNLGTLPGVYTQLAARAAAGNARFVAIGGFSCLRPAPGAPRFVEGDGVPAEYRAEAEEMFTVLQNLQADSTGADWLFVSPAAEFGAFAPGEALGQYRSGDDVALFDAAGKSAISGADFASAVLDEVETPTRQRDQINFAY